MIGKGCVGEATSPGTSLLGTGRSSAGLVALNHDGDVFTIHTQRGKQGRGGAVKVPEIVMNELEAPDKLAGFATQSDDGVGPLVVTGAEAAVIIGAGAAGGDKE